MGRSSPNGLLVVVSEAASELWEILTLELLTLTGPPSLAFGKQIEPEFALQELANTC